MWPPEPIYPQRKHKDLEAPALQRKEIKDPHPLKTLKQRPTTPLYKPITKQTTVIFIQTYTLV